MIKEIKNKFHIYILYMWKRIRDSRIQTKRYLYPTLTAVICSLTIGCVGYLVMRSAFINNAQESAVSLMKQLGTRMEERIREFEDASYSLVCEKEMRSIFE